MNPNELISERPSRHGGLTVLFELGVAARLTGTILDEALSDAGISARDFFMLSVIAGFGPLTPGDIAQRSGIPAPTVSKLLSRMFERGFAAEELHPTDGRSRIISLSDTGRQAIADAQRGFGAVLDQWYDLLGNDVADVQWALRRLDWALREMGGFEQPDADLIRHHNPGWLRYSGPPLTASEEADAIRYIEWILHRREGPGLG